MYKLIILVLPIVAIFLLPIIVAMIEKRRTWPYIHQYEFDDFQLSSANEAYISKCISSSESEGFTYLERRYDGKGKRYKVAYDFLISSDRNTLVIIGVGTVLNFPVNGMWFISKDVNGNCFTTVTSQSAVEYDLTGYHKDSLILTNDFEKVFHHHLECVAKDLHHMEPYTENSEMDVLRHLKESKIDNLNKDGWTKYVGENTDYWKYTVKGAVKIATCQIIQGVIRFPKSLLKGLLKTKNN